MKIILFLLLVSASLLSAAQSVEDLEALPCPPTNENVSNQKLFSDSLVSSFVLFIRKEVKLHKHNEHSEHVYVMDGEADMKLGEKTIHISKGNMVFIPKGTPHAVKVTSKVPLKVISLQAPFFDGKDRVMLE